MNYEPHARGIHHQDGSKRNTDGDRKTCIGHRGRSISKAARWWFDCLDPVCQLVFSVFHIVGGGEFLRFVFQISIQHAVMAHAYLSPQGNIKVITKSPFLVTRLLKFLGSDPSRRRFSLDWALLSGQSMIWDTCDH